MIDGYLPLTKPGLLREIAESRRELDELLSRVEAAEHTTQLAGAQRSEEGWSAKDVRAHVLAYERWLLGQVGGETRRLPDPPADVDLGDVDQRNAWFHSLDRDLSPEDISAEAEDVHRRLLAWIEVTPEEDLARVYTVTQRGDIQEYSPGQSGWSGWPLWRWAVSDTFDHYRQHIPDLQRRLARASGA